MWGNVPVVLRNQYICLRLPKSYIAAAHGNLLGLRAAIWLHNPFYHTLCFGIVKTFSISEIFKCFPIIMSLSCPAQCQCVQVTVEPIWNMTPFSTSAIMFWDHLAYLSGVWRKHRDVDSHLTQQVLPLWMQAWVYEGQGRVLWWLNEDMCLGIQQTCDQATYSPWCVNQSDWKCIGQQAWGFSNSDNHHH